MQPKTIIFIGPQGSGKGTQIEMLKEKISQVDSERFITHIQTGKPFRDLAAAGGYTADVVKDLMNSGKLVPNVLTNAFVVNEFVSQFVEGSHIIFDGYPRDEEQARVCSELFAVYGREQLDIIHLDTEESVVVERMMTRGREDDKTDVITERLRRYHEVTEPLLDYYKAQNSVTVHNIDGGKTEPEVHEAVCSVLNIN